MAYSRSAVATSQPNRADQNLALASGSAQSNVIMASLATGSLTWVPFVVGWRHGLPRHTQPPDRVVSCFNVTTFVGRDPLCQDRVGRPSEALSSLRAQQSIAPGIAIDRGPVVDPLRNGLRAPEGWCPSSGCRSPAGTARAC